MALRYLSRSLMQVVKHRVNIPTIQRSFIPIRSFASTQNNNDVYRDLNEFLGKEIQLEKSAQKHPSKLPIVKGFDIENKGPEVTLTRQKGNEKVTVKFNVTNTVNASESNDDASNQNPSSSATGATDDASSSSQASSQLKSRPNFTVDIHRGGQTLSFLCSFLPDDYPDISGEESGQKSEETTSDLEDFQIDEFAIHEGDWNDQVYSADCSVIDGELYDKLLNLLEEHGIGEEFANQLMDFSTAYEHRQYIGLLDKLQKFTK